MDWAEGEGNGWGEYPCCGTKTLRFSPWEGGGGGCTAKLLKLAPVDKNSAEEEKVRIAAKARTKFGGRFTAKWRSEVGVALAELQQAACQQQMVALAEREGEGGGFWGGGGWVSSDEENEGGGSGSSGTWAAVRNVVRPSTTNSVSRRANSAGGNSNLISAGRNRSSSISDGNGNGNGNNRGTNNLAQTLERYR